MLLYAVSADPSELATRDLARELLQEDDWTLSIQVMHNFHGQDMSWEWRW